MDEIDAIPGLSRRRGPGYLAVFLIAALTSAAVWIGGYFAEPHLRALLRDQGLPAPSAVEEGADGEPEVPEAPDLVGLPSRTAAAIASVLDVAVEVGEERPDADHPSGEVLEQSPAPGEPVSGTIELVVSAGPPPVSVPEVTGRPLEEARAAILEAGLRVGEVTEGGEGDPGTVTSVEPAAGTEVAPDSAVALTMAPTGGAVPDLSGMHRRQARAAITEAGFTVGRVRERYDSRARPYRVLSQDPPAGTVAEPGSEISFVANQGP